jgi:oxygen-dependent protoporphyrinogen oxidase
MFLVPTKLAPTALTRLFSLRTKIRMGMELLHPPHAKDEDESVAALVERHYGSEAVDRLADPLLSGIYGGDATQLSARTVLPRLVEMEKKYGSLTRGMLAAHKRMKEAAKKSGKGPQRGAPPAIFTALRGGMQQLVDALSARIDPGSIRAGAPVQRILRLGSTWIVESNNTVQSFDAVIMAASAWAAGEMLAPVDAELARELSGIPYSSSITVNLIYDEKKIGTLPEGFGFLVPACEGRSMLACTFVHRKFLGRTPPGKAVFRAFLGGARGETMLDESDEALIATVRRELSEILGATTLGEAMEPEHVQVSRWRRAMAQYAVGHKERMQRIQSRVAALPGLRLAGNAYDGIGVPDCIRLGRLAARELSATASDARSTVSA